MAAVSNRLTDPFLWVIPVLITIHSLEETLWVDEATLQGTPLIELPILSLLLPPTLLQMAIATGLITLFVWWVAYSACIRKKSADVLLLHFIAGVFSVNGIIHVLLSLITLHYQPGVVTALLFNLPFLLWFLKRAVQTGSFNRKQLNTTLWMAVPLIPALTLLTLSLGKGVEPLFW